MQNRHALVVLGANWCHDSRAFAARLNRSPLAEIIQQHYELVLVDVGYLNKGRDVVQQLGVAHYYATPTVLIVDPSNMHVLNNEDRHMWGNAHSIGMVKSVEYFERWATDGAVADPGRRSTELDRLNAEIDEFEVQLAGSRG